MKIVIINGSARNGNTLAAINAFIEGAKENHEIEMIQADKLNMDFCKGCGACECYKGCIDDDDTNQTIYKIVLADLVVFASPVYWWGISAQTKLVIDKCYCRGAQLKGKKVGVIVPGGSPLGAKQYDIIKDQFDCIVKYLGWDMVFYKPFYANGADELQNDAKAIAEMVEIGKSI
ncbi:MAG: flavodoxin family protein [Mogibacterium sp.]|mgnify:FL=1|nr:flavodoxin family protein [Mogibacterium sp.]